MILDGHRNAGGSQAREVGIHRYLAGGEFLHGDVFEVATEGHGGKSTYVSVFSVRLGWPGHRSRAH